MGLFSISDLEKKLQQAEEEIRLLKARLEEYTRHNARGAGRKGRMSEQDKAAIAELREKGFSYNKIAKQLNLPVGTVFNYVRALRTAPDVLNKRIKKITEIGSIDFDNFIEKSKYRSIMQRITHASGTPDKSK